MRTSRRAARRWRERRGMESLCPYGVGNGGQDRVAYNTSCDQQAALRVGVEADMRADCGGTNSRRIAQVGVEASSDNSESREGPRRRMGSRAGGSFAGVNETALLCPLGKHPPHCGRRVFAKHSSQCQCTHMHCPLSSLHWTGLNLLFAPESSCPNVVTPIWPSCNAEHMMIAGRRRRPLLYSGHHCRVNAAAVSKRHGAAAERHSIAQSGSPSAIQPSLLCVEPPGSDSTSPTARPRLFSNQCLMALATQ